MKTKNINESSLKKTQRFNFQLERVNWLNGIKEDILVSAKKGILNEISRIIIYLATVDIFDSRLAEKKVNEIALSYRTDEIRCCKEDNTIRIRKVFVV